MKIFDIRLVLLTSLCFIMYSCNSDDSDTLHSNETNTLKINLGIEEVSRALHTGTSFNSGDIIGIRIEKQDGGSYPDFPYSTAGQIKATFNGSTWNLQMPIYLSKTKATIFANYPFESTWTGNSTVYAGTEDYMYGVVQNINSDASTASIKLQHLMSRIIFRFINSNSPNGCIVSSIKLQDLNSSGKCYTTGTRSEWSTAISGVTKGSPTITGTWNFKSSTKEASMTIIPTNLTAANQAQFVINVDGANRTFNLPVINFEAGKQYTYTFTMAGNKLEATSVSITGWGTGSSIGSSEWINRNLAYGTAKTKTFNSSTGGNILYNCNGVKTGDIITISYHIECTAVPTGTCLIQFNNYAGYIGIDYPKQGTYDVVKTLTIPNQYNSTSPCQTSMNVAPYLRWDNYATDGANGKYIKISNFKVEKGSYATGWCKHIDD